MSVFFVFSSLPPLEFASKPDISSSELMQLFEENFDRKQMREVYTLKLWIDIQNIYSTLSQHAFDERGNYTKNTLKELLMHREELPDYVFEFFNRYESLEQQKKHFSWLLSAYFKNEKEKSKGYLREFLEFEHQLRVVTTGYRSKLLKREIARELQYEDLEDPVVAMTISQKDTSSTYVFPFEYKTLEAALAEAGPNPSHKYAVIAEYRFNFYTKYISESPFTFKACLAYMMCLWILEEYFALKQEKGETMLDQLLEKEDVS